MRSIVGRFFSGRVVPQYPADIERRAEEDNQQWQHDRELHSGNTARCASGSVSRHAIGARFGVGAGETIASVRGGAWALRLMAPLEGRASKQFAKYIFKGAVGVLTIVGSTAVMAADLATHMEEAGRYSDCPRGCSFILEK